MITKELRYFDISQICHSGQCFRMVEREDGIWQVVASNRYLEIKQEGTAVIFSCSEKEYETFWKFYFDMETDYGAFIERINPRDRYLMQAAEFGQGIRILKQNLWEMIVSFLISQQNNIVRIRRCIENLLFFSQTGGFGRASGR